MKLYIAGHSQEESKLVAEELIKAGHEITSTWLDEDFKRTSEYTDLDKTNIAKKDAEEVIISDGLVLLPSPRRIPGGKFVEAGIAIGLGKPIFVLGIRENMLIYHPSCLVFVTVEDMIKSIPSQSPSNP